jgi:uncharacterized membrane protein YjgN (DUF898 family)
MNNETDLTPQHPSAEGIAGPVSNSASTPHQVESQRFEFSGNGAEYFRIWLVNLVLTICTLGIYSAWAKVRKTRYFYQNTRLDGHAFDYHGNPKAILRGRIIALVLLAAYSWAFDISREAGYVTIAILCLVGPFLFLRALQFKLRNTSWRGLRLGFTANTPQAYRALLPILIIWFSGTFAGIFVDTAVYVVGIVSIVTVLCLPWMHHKLKRFQHSHFRFGALASSFESALGRFYITYLKAFGLVIVIGIVASIVMGLLGRMIFAAAESSGKAARFEAILVGVSVGGIVYLMMSTYAAVRLQRTVWSKTQLGPASFDTQISAASLAGLIFKSVMLGLLTLGLYWPYATIALARYRIENMQVFAPVDFAETINAGDSASTMAAGEGAIDMFGLDIGL